MQPVAEKTLAYSRHLYEIASETQSEFTKVAEAQLAEGTKNVQALVENFAKNAPAGSESTVAIVKSAISAAKQRVRVDPEGHEASRGNGRNQLPGCRHRPQPRLLSKPRPRPARLPRSRLPPPER